MPTKPISCLICNQLLGVMAEGSTVRKGTAYLCEKHAAPVKSAHLKKVAKDFSTVGQKKSPEVDDFMDAIFKGAGL